MIGITGTNGKTSISQLLGQALTNCHKPCGVIGTNGAGMVDNLEVLDNTTPSATDLMQLFFRFSHNDISPKKLNDECITHIAMEVSSHALEQGRVTGNTFDIAIFTNLSRDHLDYHGTMAAYAAAKRQLFTPNEKQIAVLNGDDEQTQRWLANWPTSENLSLYNTWLYGRSKNIRQHAKFVTCQNIKHHHQGVDFTLCTHLGDIDIHSPLLGDFNIDNLLAVIAVMLIEDVSLTVVDYAHTPDALEKALIACRQHCDGNLFVVFGCGGDRDKGKRPLMAQAAQTYADQLIVTNDNPRTEQPMNIIDDVLAGLNEQCKVQVIVDRKEAVLATLAKAQANDVVLLAGKGHEDYIILGCEKIDYNERDIVKNFFANYHSADSSVVGELQ